MKTLALTVLEESFTIHRLRSGAPLPAGLDRVAPCWIARTRDELSIVCPAAIEIAGSRQETGWSCVRVNGPLDFALTGVLAGITGVLASAAISVFALSTFDTDFVLVKTERLEAATRALREAGYRIDSPGPQLHPR